MGRRCPKSRSSTCCRTSATSAGSCTISRRRNGRPAATAAVGQDRHHSRRRRDQRSSLHCAARRSTCASSASSSRTGVANFDKIFPRTRLNEAVAEADVFVVLVPYSPETHHIVDRSVIEAMKPGAMLINIARGKVIDEPVLAEFLAQNRIAGAGLDVFETEPLPPDSPLWPMDNVIITPRVRRVQRRLRAAGHAGRARKPRHLSVGRARQDAQYRAALIAAYGHKEAIRPRSTEWQRRPNGSATRYRPGN